MTRQVARLFNGARKIFAHCSALRDMGLVGPTDDGQVMPGAAAHGRVIFVRAARFFRMAGRAAEVVADDEEGYVHRKPVIGYK